MGEPTTIRILVPMKSEQQKVKLEEERKDGLPRLTATGKISHAKTRVYTQRYRKEWEEMADFKGWLTSVPYEATRAFCLYCEKNLHAHRLSLLKHMCTLKHQKAANDYKKAELNKALEQGDIQHLEFIDGEVVENVADDELFEAVDETTFEVESQEVIEDEEEGESESTMIEFKQQAPEIKKVNRWNFHISSNLTTEESELQERQEDPLAKAMAHVHGTDIEGTEQMNEVLEECVTETIVASDHDSYAYAVEDKGMDQIVHENEESGNEGNSEVQVIQMEEEQNVPKKEKVVQILRRPSQKQKVPEILKLPVSAGRALPLGNSQKMIILTQDGKTFTLAGSKGLGSQFVIAGSTLKRKVPATSVAAPKAKILKPVVHQKLPNVTSNILDTSKGIAVCGLHCSLYKLVDGKWTHVNDRISGPNGEVSDFMVGAKVATITGRYKLHYDVEKYYLNRKTECMYPYIEIIFDIKIPSGTYHIPVLISPFSYSTHRDPNR